MVGGSMTSPDLDAPAVEELLVVADHVEGLAIIVGVADVFRWDWGAKGIYSTRSCYLGMFRGNVAMRAHYRSRSPVRQPSVSFFSR
jgi:hypothetical protein